MVLSGRVPWHRALELTFENDFRRLIKMSTSCARAIGSAASVFAFLVHGDRDIPKEWRSNCHMRFEKSYGTGYIFLAQSQFPELAILDNDMRLAARAPSVESAKAEYEAQISKLAIGCQCRICCLIPLSMANVKKNEAPYCLIALLETTIVMTRSLAGILSDMSPMRVGIESMYDMHVPKMRSFEQTSGLSPLQRIIENGIPGVIDPPLIYVAETIYGGQWYTERIRPESFISAIAENGLCYFLDGLREPTRSAATLGRVHIVVGRIEHLNRPYHKVQDAGETDPLFLGEPRQSPCIPNKDIETIKACSNGSIEILVKKEISSQNLPYLSAEYGVYVKDIIIGAFGPSRTVLSMCRNEGRVSCSRGACVHPMLELTRSKSISRQIQAAESAANSKHYSQIDMTPSTLHVFSSNLVTTSLAACKVWDPIIQQDECIPCCVQLAISNGWTDFGIICCGRSTRVR